MGNNIVTAIANGSAPYLANEVKNQIQGNSVESDIQRTIAHGLLNAGLALAKGENAVVQASGAMAGETVGILSHSLYGKTPEELTETEKQNISAWATLTSGIVGGLISDNSAGVANAAQAGKVVVENNWLSTNQLENFAHKARTCVGEECQQVIRDMVDANIRQQEEIKQICSTSPEQCKQQYGYLVEQWNAFDTAIKHLAADKSLPDDFRDYLPAVYMLSMDATGITVEHQWAKRFEAMGLEPEAAGLIAMALPGMINGGSGKGKGNSTSSTAKQDVTPTKPNEQIPPKTVLNQTGSDKLNNYQVHDLKQVTDPALNLSTIRQETKQYLKKSAQLDDAAISYATASVTVGGKTEYYLSVSGKSWSGQSPDKININGKNYTVIREDKNSFTSVGNIETKQTNFNHAEQKLFNHIQKTYKDQKANVNMVVQNTSQEKIGMCVSCGYTSQNFAENNKNLNVNIYQGSTGENK